jgi:uncharacterized protein DUF2877
MTEKRTYASTCIGELHSWLLHEGSGMVGKTLNAFDSTINVRTDKDELLVITLGKVRSPVNLNVTPGNANMGFKQVVGENAKASIQNENIAEHSRAMLLVGDAIIMLSEHEIFRNHFSHLDPHAIQTFGNNCHKIFSALESQAQANTLGCLLNPDMTTRGLFAGFMDQIISDYVILDRHEFDKRTSKGLQQLCGKGPGFTPAGDDFIAGYLAMSNWLSDSMKLGDALIPGNDFSVLTTWTSFKLIEYGARNLLDDQVQQMINCVAQNDVDAYIQAVRLISKRGHTSGLDFATGMTIALFTTADRVFKTSVLKSIVQVLDSSFIAPES